MAHLTDFKTDNQYQAKVKASKRLTPQESDEVREILLEVDDPAFRCEVNQSFGVLVKVNSEFGNDYHHRLYSVADIPENQNGKTQLTMLVKRCYYVDDFNGERYEGIGSNFLCNLQGGDELTITGPFPIPFQVPEDQSANLILIGMGTGIAPFRSLVKHIYKNESEWKGKIRLYYGAKTGLELLYLNEKDGDLTNYYDQNTFEAFHALSPRPNWSDDIALEDALIEKSEELREMLALNNTYIYVAGYELIRKKLDEAFSNILGSPEAWLTRKAELLAGNKWAEVIY
ncbi:MAG: ferredoxin-NADP reductase [Flammeovirgaceae bacterium]